MAILDYELTMVTATAMDLGNPGLRSDGTVAPHGPGRQIHLQASEVTTTVVVTSSDTEGGSYGGSTTFTCGGADAVECHLPSYTKRWIKAVFADGAVNVVLDSAQTNG